ncbi:hypothetical protein Pcinc_025591 [Petrolisthes cinctipes]|uniref:Uncharacterized protein n=1 Tax=Petrolisthes cinctipes TaxID=88211 RepID=A0AAE1F8Y3_PETCI|nr:hypothetical protein Pcinc_025591 [Petrolisthes cinctipes]
MSVVEGVFLPVTLTSQPHHHNTQQQQHHQSFTTLYLQQLNLSTPRAQHFACSVLSEWLRWHIASSEESIEKKKKEEEEEKESTHSSLLLSSLPPRLTHLYLCFAPRIPVVCPLDDESEVSVADVYNYLQDHIGVGDVPECSRLYYNTLFQQGHAKIPLDVWLKFELEADWGDTAINVRQAYLHYRATHHLTLNTIGPHTQGPYAETPQGPHTHGEGPHTQREGPHTEREGPHAETPQGPYTHRETPQGPHTHTHGEGPHTHTEGPHHITENPTQGQVVGEMVFTLLETGLKKANSTDLLLVIQTLCEERWWCGLNPCLLEVWHTRFNHSLISHSHLSSFMSVCRCLPPSYFLNADKLQQLAPLLTTLMAHLLGESGEVSVRESDVVFLCVCLLSAAAAVAATSHTNTHITINTHLTLCLNPLRPAIVYHWEAVRGVFEREKEVVLRYKCLSNLVNTLSHLTPTSITSLTHTEVALRLLALCLRRGGERGSGKDWEKKRGSGKDWGEKRGSGKDWEEKRGRGKDWEKKRGIGKGWEEKKRGRGKNEEMEWKDTEEEEEEGRRRNRQKREEDEERWNRKKKENDDDDEEETMKKINNKGTDADERWSLLLRSAEGSWEYLKTLLSYLGIQQANGNVPLFLHSPDLLTSCVREEDTPPPAYTHPQTSAAAAFVPGNRVSEGNGRCASETVGKNEGRHFPETTEKKHGRYFTEMNGKHGRYFTESVDNKNARHFPEIMDSKGRYISEDEHTPRNPISAKNLLVVRESVCQLRRLTATDRAGRLTPDLLFPPFLLPGNDEPTRNLAGKLVPVACVAVMLCSLDDIGGGGGGGGGSSGGGGGSSSGGGGSSGGSGDGGKWGIGGGGGGGSSGGDGGRWGIGGGGGGSSGGDGGRWDIGGGGGGGSSGGGGGSGDGGRWGIGGGSGSGNGGRWGIGGGGGRESGVGRGGKGGKYGSNGVSVGDDRDKQQQQHSDIITVNQFDLLLQCYIHLNQVMDNHTTTSGEGSCIKPYPHSRLTPPRPTCDLDYLSGLSREVMGVIGRLGRGVLSRVPKTTLVKCDSEVRAAVYLGLQSSDKK